MRVLIVWLALSVAAVPARAFTELAGYQEGARVAGWEVRSVYLDTEGQPMGARYRHPNGLLVDLLRFASVPQVSLNFASLADSDRGEPHTQEHLLLGKGTVGQAMNSLMSMSLSDHTAATYSELTNYQFHTSAGPEVFYRLLRGYLQALLRPDYSDTEIRREVAHLGAEPDPKTGKLALEEKGTVYNEMVSTMEKADAVNWYQLVPALFGAESPLARNQGGAPDAIRLMTPAHIRTFHARNYHFGSNLELIAALPPDYSPEDFLKRLDAIMAELEPAAAGAEPGCLPGSGAASGQPCDPYAKLPPHRPVEGAPILLGEFPSEDEGLPQTAAFAWKPLKAAPSPLDALELKLFLSVLADGETSLLYRDLVDEKTRTLESGAANVSSYFEPDPANAPMVFVSGLPPVALTEAKLAELRAAILARVRAAAEAKKGSEPREELRRKARSLLASWRRAQLKFIDAPPGFGFRHSGVSWHRHLAELSRGEGFRRAVAMTPAYDALSAKLDADAELWGELIRRHGLDRAPLVSAVRPSKALLERERAARERRLAEASAELRKGFGAKDEQAALRRYREEFEKDSAALKTRDAAIPRPGFVDSPPLTLDETIDWEQGELLPGARLVVSRFPSTPFTDLSLRFDLRGVPAEELRYLPVLPLLLTELGARTAKGERLDYALLRERWRAEIYALGAGIASEPRTGRLELAVSASGSSPEENRRAVEWLRTLLFRAELGPQSAGRLRTVVSERIKELRGVFQQSEESWVNEAAAAYRHQEDARFLSVESPFTALHHLSRVYFGLSRYESERARELTEMVLRDLMRGAEGEPRERMAERLGRLAAGTGLPASNPAVPYLKDAAAYFKDELARLPEDSWRPDLGRILRETYDDLARDPAEEMRRLKTALAGALARTRVSAAVTGSPKNTAAILPELRALAAELPEGGPRAAAALPNPVLARLKERFPELERRPAHAALVNNDTKSGVFVITASAPGYKDAGTEPALDSLAGSVFSGAAPHTFFLKTWGAGLAYSNGVRIAPGKQRIRYYAERCPRLTATMEFVAGLARETKLDAPFFVDFALANHFDDYRGAQGFSERGAALYADLADGNDPERVRAFKVALLAAARRPDALEQVRARLPRVLGSVLIGYGAKVSESPGATAFVIGPEPLLAEYEGMLKKLGEAERLIRLYPRDFYIFE